MTFYKQSLAIAAMAMALTACGGGGSSSTCVDGGSGCSGSSSGSGTAGTTVTPVLALGTGSDSSFQSGALTITNSSLSAGGSTGVSVNIVNTAASNALYAQSTTVSFTSTCAGQNPAKATIDSTVTTTGGVATANYTAAGCVGQDTITASLDDGTTATGIVTVASQTIGSIAFDSASANPIALSGIGSTTLPSTSKITFKVLDKDGAVVTGQTVSFSLSSTLGGITITQPSAVSGNDGTVSTTLVAGSVNTTARVIATLTTTSGEVISTSSSPIAMSSGLPDQLHFSVALTTFRPAAGQHDDVTSSVTVHAADKFGNPVPDGTSISFIAVGGAIPGSCQTSAGVCKVDWYSQDPRPDGLNKALGTKGIAKILIRTIGEDSYNDANSNGIYDLNETVLTNLGEAFLDLNADGIYSAASASNNYNGEFFSDFNHDGSYTAAPTTAVYRGSSCSTAAKDAGNCAQTSVDVWDEETICMSTDSIDSDVPTLPSSFILGSNTFYLTDSQGISPADGTTIAVSTDNGVLLSSAAPKLGIGCRIGGLPVTIQLGTDGTPSTGTVTIKITQADGNQVTKTVPFSD